MLGMILDLILGKYQHRTDLDDGSAGNVSRCEYATTYSSEREDWLAITCFVGA